jgi:hypothetical protein
MFSIDMSDSAQQTDNSNNFRRLPYGVGSEAMMTRQLRDYLQREAGRPLVELNITRPVVWGTFAFQQPPQYFPVNIISLRLRDWRGAPLPLQYARAWKRDQTVGYDELFNHLNELMALRQANGLADLGFP